ncbi:hypothetical protein Dimus_024069 [Dionaea muscipula]
MISSILAWKAHVCFRATPTTTTGRPSVQEFSSSSTIESHRNGAAVSKLSREMEPRGLNSDLNHVCEEKQLTEFEVESCEKPETGHLTGVEDGTKQTRTSEETTGAESQPPPPPEE